MSEYIFLYRGGRGRDWAERTPEEIQQTMAKWGAWIRDLVAAGKATDPGQPLQPTGKVVRTGHAVSDGPYAEKDVVGGYTLISASSLDEAAELTKGCPIFDVDGYVEVRPIINMTM